MPNCLENKLEILGKKTPKFIEFLPENDLKITAPPPPPPPPRSILENFDNFLPGAFYSTSLQLGTKEYIAIQWTHNVVFKIL